LSALDTGSIDLCVTSPPYDNLRSYNGFSWNFEYIAQQTYRVLKPGGVLVWVVGDSVVDGSETLSSFEQALYFKKHAGFRMWDTMIWQKLTPGLFPKRYTPDFEYMFVLSKGEPKTFNAQLKRNKYGGEFAGGGARDKNGFKPNKAVEIKEWGVMENVWNIQGGASLVDRNGHPAPFPEELARRHIATWTDVNDTVLDYFGGSGTTAKVARLAGRRYLTNDISREYCDLMERRLAAPYTPSFLPMLAG
jgi:DNA modification methylase